MCAFVRVLYNVTRQHLEWRRYTAIQRAKRKGKKTGEESTVVEEIVLQQMIADVSGKQQKYTRIGPQEYVPFEHEEITIVNRVRAILRKEGPYSKPKSVLHTVYKTRRSKGRFQ